MIRFASLSSSRGVLIRLYFEQVAIIIELRLIGLLNEPTVPSFYWKRIAPIDIAAKKTLVDEIYPELVGVSAAEPPVGVSASG